MQHVVEVIYGHPLSPYMTFAEGELEFKTGTEITSVEMALQYLRLFHNGLSEVANDIINDPVMKCQPSPLMAAIVEESLKSQPRCVPFELRVDRIIESIISEQLKDKNGVFRRAFDREIKAAGDRKIVFNVYGPDPILHLGPCQVPPGLSPALNALVGASSAFRAPVGVSSVFNVPVGIGRNVYGNVLEKLAEKIRRHEALDYELPSFFQRQTFDTVFKRSVIVVSDSQSGHLHSVQHGGEVYAISGGQYGDIFNVLNNVNSEEFALIVIFVGTNCFKSDYIGPARNGEFMRLKNKIADLLKNRSNTSVLFSYDFDPGTENVRHMAWIENELREIGVKCLNWRKIENPFVRSDRSWKKELFNGIHLTDDGMRLLYDAWSKELPKLRLLMPDIRSERKTILRQQFSLASMSRRPYSPLQDSRRPRSKSPLIDVKAQKRSSSPFRPEQVYDRRSEYRHARPDDRRSSPDHCHGLQDRSVRIVRPRSRSPTPNYRHSDRNLVRKGSRSPHRRSRDRRASRSRSRSPKGPSVASAVQKASYREKIPQSQAPSTSQSGREGRGQNDLDDEDRSWKRRGGHSSSTY